MSDKWWKVTVTDAVGKDYIRFGKATDLADAQVMATEECTRGVGLTVKSVAYEPLGAMALLIYKVPPDYPQA